jgi:hypothetical protein
MADVLLKLGNLMMRIEGGNRGGLIFEALKFLVRYRLA